MSDETKTKTVLPALCLSERPGRGSMWVRVPEDAARSLEDGTLPHNLTGYGVLTYLFARLHVSTKAYVPIETTLKALAAALQWEQSDEQLRKVLHALDRDGWITCETVKRNPTWRIGSPLVERWQREATKNKANKRDRGARRGQSVGSTEAERWQGDDECWQNGWQENPHENTVSGDSGGSVVGSAASADVDAEPRRGSASVNHNGDGQGAARASTAHAADDEQKSTEGGWRLYEERKGLAHLLGRFPSAAAAEAARVAHGPGWTFIEPPATDDDKRPF